MPAATSSVLQYQTRGVNTDALKHKASPHRATPLLAKAQGLVILPVYKRLAEEELLARRFHGKTRNGEFLNSNIWLLCLKNRFASRTAVETAKVIAPLWYIRGYASFEQVLQELRALVTLTDCTDSTHMQKM